MTDEPQTSDDLYRLAAVERQLAYLYAHFGLDPSAADQVELPLPAEVEAFIGQKGSRLAAVKAYRKAFGANLADATKAVKRLSS